MDADITAAFQRLRPEERYVVMTLLGLPGRNAMSMPPPEASTPDHARPDPQS
jgi:hypothetical protein